MEDENAVTLQIDDVYQEITAVLISPDSEPKVEEKDNG
jgi:hypothetical protein